MTAYTSQRSGYWNTPSDDIASPWHDGGAQTALASFPTVGDTALVAHDVTIGLNTTIGTSGAAGTLVLDVDGGDLTIAEDVTLTLRGDMEVDVGDTLTLQAGATLKFDSSLSADPPNTAYRLHLSKTYYQAGYLVCTGTADNRCRITSETANSAAYGLIKSSVTGGLSGSIQADYIDFQYLGSASEHSVYVDCQDHFTGDVWIKNATFDNCGKLSVFIVDPARTFTLQHVVFTNPLATLDFQMGSQNPAGSQMIFDHVVFCAGAATLVYRAGVTMTNCYMPKGFGASGTDRSQFTAFENNFVIDPIATTLYADGTTSENGWKDSLFLENAATGAPITLLTRTETGDCVINGCVFEADYDTNSASAVRAYSGGAGNKLIVKNCLALPTSRWAASGSLVSVYGDADTTVDVYHNTACVNSAVGAISVGNTYVGHAGIIDNVKSNLLWSSPLSSQGLGATRTSGSNVQDLITPANWDYNWGWDLAAGTEGGGFTDNGGPGDMFSTVPTNSNGGSGDPGFVDSTRRIATYDSATTGLANIAGNWATATSYAVGEFAANTDPNLYNNVTINFRCIAAHTSDATTEPGVGANWRSYWEYATLYRLRQNTSLIAALHTWIKDGFAPTNVALQNAGHDAATIGAVEYIDAVPAPTPTVDFAAILATWEAKMLSYGATHAANWSNGTYDFAYGYYDAQRVFYNIADYTGDDSWLAIAETAGAAYRDQYVLPNNGTTTGYWNFTRGLYEDWVRNADASSRTALVLISQNAAYANDIAPLASTEDSTLSREVAYAINSYIDAERSGEAHRDRMEDLVEQVIGTGGHFDQWFIDEADPDFAPFMFALSCEAMINYWTYISEDARILAKMQVGADWIWDNAWVAADDAFWYRWSDTSSGSADLGLLIAPLFGWLYWKTGDTKYRERGDKVFRGGVNGAYMSGSKQFNQCYRWSFDYVTWRSLGSASYSVLVKFLAGSGRLVLQTKQS